jgi:phage gp29-like protein
MKKPTGSLTGEVMATQVLVINKNIGSINVAFTPEYYKRAYSSWLNGDYRYLLALIDRAETDSFISGCLAARHLGYKRKFQMQPATDSAYDKEIAEFVQEVFNNLFMREFFEDMIDARMKYYSVISLEWDIANGKQIPVYAEKLAQKYFRYDPKDNILKVDWGKTLKEIPADSAFVLESSRKPIMLNVLKNYIMKEFGEQNWSSFLERFGEPFIFAFVPPNADKETLDNVDSSLKKMASSTTGRFPKGTELKIEEAQRSTGDQQKYLQTCMEGISLALLGHKDAAGSDSKMQIGDNTSGIEVKKGIAIDDIFWIEEKITTFIKMIVNRNYNTSVYPKLIIDKSDAIDAKTKLQAAEQAIEGGAQIAPEFYKDMGIPIVSEDPIQKRTIAQEFNLD